LKILIYKLFIQISTFGNYIQFKIANKSRHKIIPISWNSSKFKRFYMLLVNLNVRLSSRSRFWNTCKRSIC